MQTYTEAVTEEYNWITVTLAETIHSAVKAEIESDPEVARLRGVALELHGELMVDEKPAKNFFHIMEELKGILGDLSRAINA